MRPQHWVYTIPLRLRSLFRWAQVDRELDDELRDHLDRKTEEYVAQGRTQEEARRRARIDMDGIEQTKEKCRDARRVNWLQDFVHDLRFGLRILRKSPGFTAVSVLTLALGIGANTAIFAVLDTVVLRPLPFQNADRLVRVGEWGLHNAPTIGEVSYPNFLDWRAENHVFGSMAVFHTGTFTLIAPNEAVHLEGAVVSSDLFSLLGVAPTIGRSFLAEEDEPGAGNTGRPVVLSWELWQTRFEGDPKSLGRSINLDNRSFTIVGVMPKGFQFPIQAEPAQLWVTIGTEAGKIDEKPPATADRSTRYLQVIARLKPKVNLSEARADMAVVASHLEKEYPGPDSSTGAWLVPELGAVVGDVKAELYITFTAVGLVLLIGCANVANLLLVRATGRKKEIAIRSALGAGRSRIARQMVTESMLLSVIGASSGILLALWGTSVFVKYNPLHLPRLAETHLDARVLGFAILLALLTGFIFGLGPAVRAPNADFIEGFKEGADSRGAVGRAIFRNALVVGEIALALVLAAGAGLLAKSLYLLTSVKPGFDPHNVLTFNVDLPGNRYSIEKRIEFYRQLISRLTALPGVESASAIAGLPLAGDAMGCSFEIEGHPTPKGEYGWTFFRAVTTGYFQTMKIPLLQGRDFTERDDIQTTPVAVINQTLARQYFPDIDPVGKTDPSGDLEWVSGSPDA